MHYGPPHATTLPVLASAASAKVCNTQREAATPAASYLTVRHCVPWATKARKAAPGLTTPAPSPPPHLLEEIQQKYKVLITGPTTFAAILNSLQMGFRTLAIEKRSSEVWNILGAVKREFDTFGGLLQKAQKNIQGGLDDIDKLVGTRTKVIQRKLRGVEALDAATTKLLLDGDTKTSEPSEDDEL